MVIRRRHAFSACHCRRSAAYATTMFISEEVAALPPPAYQRRQRRFTPSTCAFNCSSQLFVFTPESAQSPFALPPPTACRLTVYATLDAAPPLIFAAALRAIRRHGAARSRY